jgi:hypothetical protein
MNTSRHTRTLLYPSKNSEEKKMSTSCLIYTLDMRRSHFQGSSCCLFSISSGNVWTQRSSQGRRFVCEGHVLNLHCTLPFPMGIARPLEISWTVAGGTLQQFVVQNLSWLASATSQSLFQAIRSCRVARPRFFFIVSHSCTAATLPRRVLSS